MTYSEYLQSLGADAETIKTMDTPVGRKAFEKLQADAATASAEAARQKKIAEDYQERVNSYFEDETTKRAKIENDLVSANARAAAATAALKTAQERGLIDVAKDLGFNLDAPPAPDKKEPPALDASKYFTKDDILQIAEKESAAIAIASDIAAEHVYLFGKPLRNMRELRAEAVQRKLPLEQVWQEKYGVVQARTDRDAADRKAAEDAIRKDERDKVTTEFASKYANPDVRPLTESRTPFTPRPQVQRDKQPWENGFEGDSGSSDRVRRATQAALKSATMAGVH